MYVGRGFAGPFEPSTRTMNANPSDLINPATASREELSERNFVPAPVLRPRQQVEQQLKQAILSGTIRKGERFPSESKLAEQFAVSRATVREALRSLAESGLIRKLPGASGGSFVEYVDHHSLSALLADRLRGTLELGSIDYAEVDQLLEILEVLSARLAAKQRTEEQLAALRALVDEADADRDPAELEAEFHGVLGEASGNRVLASLLAALHRVQRPQTARPTAAAQHAALVSAVADGDAERAADLTSKHLHWSQG